MSTILKALRRLEEERESEARDLRDQVVARPPASEPRPRLPLLVGAGAVGAALVIGGFLYLQRDGGTPATPAPLATSSPPAPPAPSAERARSVPETRLAVPPPPREAPPPARVASAPRPTPAVASPPPAPSARVSTPAPAPRPSLRATAPTPAPRPTPPAREPAPAPEPVAVAAVASPPPAPPASREPEAPPAAAPPEAVAFSPPAVAETAPVAEPDPSPPIEAAPALVGEPEVARRRPLPRMVVQRTLWHPYNERRVAYLTVEGHEGTVELREGDAVGEAVVKQIDPSAVLFVHRGVEIRRRVGATN